MMKKIFKAISLIIVVIILVFFFAPKNATDLPTDEYAEAVKNKYFQGLKCKCYGFEKFEKNVQLIKSTCYGLPLCKIHCRKKINNNWQDVQCDEKP